MRTFILVLLLSAVIACAYASAVASDEEATVDKRFLFKKHFFRDLGRKIKKTVKKVEKKVENVGKDIGKTAKKVVKTVGDGIKKTGKDIAKTTKHVVDEIVKTFKVQGKFINHFVTKSGKDVGHFFEKEGKQVGHTLVVAGKKIEHIGRDVYEEVRDEVKKELKKINYDAVLKKLVSMIDSTITELACAEIAKQAVVAVGGPELEPAVQTAGPLIKKICSVGLHLIEMAAQEGVKHVHINNKIH